MGCGTIFAIDLLHPPPKRVAPHPAVAYLWVLHELHLTPMHATRILAACLAAFMAACGGGGDDGAPADPEASMTVLQFRGDGALLGQSKVSNCAVSKAELAPRFKASWYQWTLVCVAAADASAMPWSGSVASLGLQGQVTAVVPWNSPSQAGCTGVMRELARGGLVVQACAER